MQALVFSTLSYRGSGPAHGRRPSRPARHAIASLALAASLLLCTGAAQAQSEASLALSAVPLASVVVAGASAGATAGASVVLPAALVVSGAVLVVKAVEVSARGTVCVLERVSDGATASVEVLGRGVSAAGRGVALSVGTTVAVSVIGTGVVLSAAGEAIAFIPNAVGRALLYDERL